MNVMIGSVTASCGHVLQDGDKGRPVMYGDETCVAGEGFIPCVRYAHYCTACADALQSEPHYLADDAAADAWLADWRPVKDRFPVQAKSGGGQ